MRFLTLTSSDEAPDDIQRSWRCLYMRLKRRGIKLEYIKVPETDTNGRQHLHILYRGDFIHQKLIKAMWRKIHYSSIVDIRLVRTYGKPARIASYMAKYMAKEMSGRYSWSWFWVWPGFCKHWTIYKRWWRYFIDREGVTNFKNCIMGWDFLLKGIYIADFDFMQAQCRHKVPFNWTDCFPLHQAASAHAQSRPSVSEPAKQVALTGVLS